jgi:uncharacterized protein (DUF1330 family)
MKMAKGYWIASYKSISDPNALAEYAKLAGPAITAGGGRFLARGNPVTTFENGIALRLVVIEFESVDKATACYQSPTYQTAVRALKNTADRDIRIIEGVS